jgi:hypothetical protein
MAYLESMGKARSTADTIMAQNMSIVKSFMCGLK